ncbi:EF-hand domain-containing protein [Luteolibacter sp. Populi]|uniref:EF-hand domain-containing protein n=1 Tax=Luteolibacter sp. Populi TaxID=3230487 RepID=UPI0034672941
MTSTILTRLSLLACAVALPGTALAGAPTAGELEFAAADIAPADGSLNKEEFTTTLPEGSKPKFVNKQFKKANFVKSESLTLEEYLVYIGDIEAPTKQELSFRVADLNLNGGIDLAELNTATPGKSPFINIVKTFLIADDDANDELSRAEWTLLKTGKAKPAKGEKFLKFVLADANENNQLTNLEFASTFPRGTVQAKVDVKFDKLDKNDDTFLTRDEYNPGAPKTPPAP